VLNNFSDLKSSNDYLHIIRLRYDNRWLKTYWEGKLKEVEKDYNFYISTPLKNKIFSNHNSLTSNLNTLDLNLLSNSLESTTPFKSNSQEISLNKLFFKKTKSSLDEGAVKNNFYTNDLINFFVTPQNKYNLDNIFTEYRFIKSFYCKNTAKTISNLDSMADL